MTDLLSVLTRYLWHTYTASPAHCLSIFLCVTQWLIGRYRFGQPWAVIRLSQTQ